MKHISINRILARGLVLACVSTLCMGAFDAHAASIVQEFRASPRILIFQWGPERARPQLIKDELSWLESSREFLDGAFLYLDNTTFNVMNNSPFSYNTAANELAPLKNLAMTKFKYHMIQIDNNLNNPLPDPFDDWSVVIQNWATVAKACKDFNLVGIAYDNEEYTGCLTCYSNKKYKSTKTIQQYSDQIALRAKQIMEAAVAQYPQIAVLQMKGPYESEPKGPNDHCIYRTSGTHQFMGSFFAGLLEGKGD